MIVAKNKSKGRYIVLLVLILGGAWLARDRVAGMLTGVGLGTGSVPTERLAEAAEDRIERLVRNGLTSRVRFSEVELQSLLTYRAAPFLPAGVEHPRIAIQDSVIILSAQLRPAEMTDFATPDALRAMLADSSWVTAVVEPSVDRPGRLLVDVKSLQIGELAVPSFLLPMVLDGLASAGYQTSGGALVAPLPDEVASVRIDGDDFVIEPVMDAD